MCVYYGDAHFVQEISAREIEFLILDPGFFPEEEERAARVFNALVFMLVRRMGEEVIKYADLIRAKKRAPPLLMLVLDEAATRLLVRRPATFYDSMEGDFNPDDVMQ